MKTLLLRKLSTSVLILAFLFSGLASQVAVADIVSTETAMDTQTRALDREQLRDWLARDDVREQLIAYGVSPEAAEERIDALTDAELRQLSQHMDDAPAGGQVIELLLLIIIILLLIR